MISLLERNDRRYLLLCFSDILSTNPEREPTAKGALVRQELLMVPLPGAFHQPAWVLLFQSMVSNV